MVSAIKWNEIRGRSTKGLPFLPFAGQYNYPIVNYQNYNKSKRSPVVTINNDGSFKNNVGARNGTVTGDGRIQGRLDEIGLDYNYKDCSEEAYHTVLLYQHSHEAVYDRDAELLIDGYLFNEKVSNPFNKTH